MFEIKDGELCFLTDLDSIDFVAFDCFSSVIGLHQVTFDDGSGRQCDGDFTSSANITSSQITINSCYNGTNESTHVSFFSDDRNISTLRAILYTQIEIYYCIHVYSRLSLVT